MTKQVLEYEIADHDRVFFLHIPKTAGTSFAAILEHHFDKDEIYPFYLMRELAETPKSVFENSRYIRGHFFYDVLLRLLKPQPVTLTMLRDPVDRFISQFAQIKRADNLGITPERLQQLQSMSLSELVFNSEFITRFGFQNLQTRQIASQLDDSMFEVPTNDQLIRLAMALKINVISAPDLELAKQRLREFAFFGLLERFNESLLLLSYVFGWPPITDFQKENVAPSKPHRETISAETLEQIKVLNKLDIELYEYAEQLLDERLAQMTQELLEKYGEAKHANLPLPLDTNTLVELLEKHYRHRYAMRHKLVESLHFTFDQALYGSQWQLVEFNPSEGAFRWSGPGTKSTMDLPLAKTASLQIKFRVLMALEADILKSLKLTVNGQSIPLRSHQDAIGAWIFEGNIASSILALGDPFARLEFDVNHTVTPQALYLDSPDQRALGCAFNWLEIKPI